uniref:Leucine rich repeat containing 56 n=1 Tax=Phocoena sinus TaxID=42100 RepID=A0A8C9BTL8_PHOSS
MDQAWDRAHGPWPSIASVQVRALSWQSRHKPRPKSKAPGSRGGSHSRRLPEEHLSPARLQALAQVDDLRLVSVLELCVNTHENSLGNFGLHLPNLSQLKLNGSCLGSLRDLGTSLGRLQVLWLARCGLADLDGIGSFPALKELYLSYNDVSDLSPLCLLEQLEVLDLEGNCVQDPGQLRYLQLCPRLATLTLEGNPLCLWPGPGPAHQVPQGYNYRAEVRKLIPQLQVLDELPATHTHLPTSRKLDHDWLVVKEAIKEGSVLDSLLPGLGSPHGSPVWRRSPELGSPETQRRAPRPWPRSLLVPGGPLPAGLLPQGPAPEDDASSLTHEPSRTLGYNLTPSPPKSLMPSDRGSSSWGSTDMQFRGRRLRALDSLGPGLGQGLAAVTALRALEVASGPSPRAEGCPGPKPAPDPAARPPASSACRT